MDKELELELKRKYPRVFADLYEKTTTKFTSCLYWGIETGAGWYKLIDECAGKIEKEIDNWLKDPANKKAVEQGVFPKAEQVKEKFAGLRFYINTGNKAMYDAIIHAEELSSKTCETCGKPGKVRGKGWIYVACDECEQDNERRRDERTKTVISGGNKEALPT
jgi:hypothetical protein